jgi:hypothetical protein
LYGKKFVTCIFNWSTIKENKELKIISAQEVVLAFWRGIFVQIRGKFISSRVMDCDFGMFYLMKKLRK